MKETTKQLFDTHPTKRLRELEEIELRQLQQALRAVRDVAGSVRAPLVAYFVDMAYLEVSAILSGLRPIRPDTKNPDLN